MRITRFEFRLDSDTKERIETTVEPTGESASDFARTAAIECAQAVLRAHRTTIVPQAFFGELLAVLDRPVERNENLTRAAGRARDLIKRK